MSEKNIFFPRHGSAPGQKRHWVIPSLMILILLGGLGWLHKARKQTGELLSQNLLNQAAAVARTINPEQLQKLSFTDGDVNRPEFRRLCFQMRAYAETVGLRSLYSMALRDGQIVFGPESLPAGDPYASPPGRVYEQPAPQDFEIFKSGKASVQGPRTDEYGAFVTALAPVLDPDTGGVLMVVGLDVETVEWRAALLRAQRAPILFTAGLLAILLAGSLLTHKYGRTDGTQSLRYAEAIVSATIMLILTLAAAWTVHGTESRHRHQTFSALAQAQASGIGEKLAELRTLIITTKLFFESSVHVDRDEFDVYTGGFSKNGFTQGWVWAPEIAAPGYDWGSAPGWREAIEEAVRTGLPVITAPDERTMPTNGPSGLLVMQSVRTATQTGVVAVVFRMDRLLRTQLYKSGLPETELSAGLFQLECGKPPRFLASSSDKCSQACWEHHAGLSLATPVFIFGRSYVVLVHPEHDWLAAHPLRNGGRVGVAGIMLTALITAFIAFLSNRQALLKRMVQRRTVELQESEASLHEAQHMAQVYNWSHDLQAGEVVWSDEAFRIFGIEKQPVTRELVDTIMHPDDLHILKEAMEAASCGRAINETETRFIRPDGTTGWLFNRWQSVYDQSGREIKRVGIGQNITERKQKESELTRLSAAITQSAEAVVITNAEGVIEYVNPAFETVTGYSSAEVVGKLPSILKSGRQDDAFYRNMWQTLLSGQMWTGRIINRRKDGILYTEDASISPVKNSSGTITGYVGVKRDITEEESREERLRQSQKMEAVGQLAGGIAHDFNNILQAILGFSELLMERLETDCTEHRHAAEIQKAAKRAAEMTQHLLAFSRKQTVDKRRLDLNTTIRDTEVLLQLLLGVEIKCAFDLAPDLNQTYADDSQVTQLIMNLAVNARDAMPNGGRLVFATKNITFEPQATSAVPGAEPGSFVCLSVTDTGIGMSREVKEHLFEPFFTTKEVGKGTGLGLAMVYGIVKQNKGWIHVYSEAGHGTTFNVYLPTCKAAAPEKQAVQTYKGRILLVEDDTDMRNLIIRILGTSGYEPVAASSAEEALKLFKQEKGRFDLLFSDMVMAGKSGMELADALRAENPGLPVLLFSGYQDQHDRWTSLKSKGYHFLQKPFTIAGLLAIVHDTMTEKIQ